MYFQWIICKIKFSRLNARARSFQLLLFHPKYINSAQQRSRRLLRVGMSIQIHCKWLWHANNCCLRYEYVNEFRWLQMLSQPVLELNIVLRTDSCRRLNCVLIYGKNFRRLKIINNCESFELTFRSFRVWTVHSISNSLRSVQMNIALETTPSKQARLNDMNSGGRDSNTHNRVESKTFRSNWKQYTNHVEHIAISIDAYLLLWMCMFGASAMCRKPLQPKVQANRNRQTVFTIRKEEHDFCVTCHKGVF